MYFRNCHVFTQQYQARLLYVQRSIGRGIQNAAYLPVVYCLITPCRLPKQQPICIPNDCMYQALASCLHRAIALLNL